MQNVSLESQETDSEIKKIAGRSIIKMGFLPDSRLFSVGPEILKSRLLRNANISLKRHPGSGKEIEVQEFLDKIDSFSRELIVTQTLLKIMENTISGIFRKE